MPAKRILGAKRRVFYMAMPATAEIIFETQAVEQPPVILVPEMSADKMVQFRAARFIGSCITGQEVERQEIETIQPIESLYDAIQLSAEGDLVARKMVATNVRTDVIERTIKAGHVIKVDLQVDEAGRIQQHGQTMESVQANSLRFASSSEQMRERTEAETTNAFRIEQLFRQGTLNDYSFVVFSRAADNMTEAEMDKVGFFTDTMSCAIQVTTATEGKLTTESAFVAGKFSPEAERHDDSTLVAVGDQLSVDFRNKSSAEVIAMPVLIPNELIPNGAIDIVRLWDEVNGTFFGEAKPQQDYLDYLELCQQREDTLQPIVANIVDELVGQASQINTRLEATQRLNKLSGKHMVRQAAFDTTINPRVFGEKAAVQIEEARQQFQLGNNQAGLDAVKQAIKYDNSKSCPSLLEKDLEDMFSSNDNTEKSDEDCEFISKECPKCHKKNVKTTVTKHRITGDCGCSVRK